MAKYERTYNAFFRQFVFIGILIFICMVIFDQLRFFVGAFLGAITLYIVLRQMLFTLTERHKWKPWAASLLLVAGTTLVLLGVGFLIFEVTAKQLVSIDTSKIATSLKGISEQVNDKVGFKLLSPGLIGQYSSVIQKAITSILNTTYSFAINVFMMLVILYFMLTNARSMESGIRAYQPFKGDSLSMIVEEVKGMVYGNAVGIPLIMLAQGVTAWIIYKIYGFDDAAFWAFLTAFAGMLPVVGTLVVTGPLGIYLMVEGHMWGGILLIALGLLVIANMDNLVRIILMKKVANTHPLVVIFGVVLGIPLFGFWGIIFGPLLISGFLLLVKIYYREYGLITPKELKKLEDDKREDEDRSRIVIGKSEKKE